MGFCAGEFLRWVLVELEDRGVSNYFLEMDLDV